MIEGNRDEANGATAAARQDIEATRERMSGTIAEIEQRVSGSIQGVKQKADVVSLVRQHPWPALAAAFVAGVALSASGADRRAARATRQAAKDTPEAARRAADDAPGSGGLKAKATGAIQAQVQELKDEVRRGADELGGTAPPPGSPA